MKLDIESGLNKLTISEVAAMYEHWNGVEGITLRDQMNAMSKVGKIVGIPLTNEQLLFVCINNTNVLCDAGPGAGKSVCSIFALLHRHYFLKTPMTACLVILYTRQAREDYEKKCTAIIDKLNNSGLPFLRVDGYPDVRTMHRLAHLWVTEYSYELGYDKLTMETVLLEDSQEVFEDIMSEHFEETYYLLSGYEMKQIVQFYTYIQEGGIDLPNTNEETLYSNRYYPTKRLNKQQLIEIYDKYETYKLIKSKMDFTDFIMKFKNLLLTDDHMRKRVQTAYQFIISDEHQDQSPTFIEIEKLIAGDTNKIKAMGDSDQTLFNFRGIETYNMLEFKNHYKNSVVTTLSYNMRCPAKIVDISNNLIQNNKLRYEKYLYGIEKPHYLEMLEISNKYDVINSVVSIIRNTPEKERGSIGVLYRNVRASGLLSTYLLFKTNIKFSVHSGIRPFSDLLSRAMLVLLNLPFDEDNRNFLRKLYYFTPLTKEQALAVYEKHNTLQEYRASLSTNSKLAKAVDDLFDYIEMGKAFKPVSIAAKTVLQNIYLYYINFINDKIVEAGDMIDYELFEIVEEFFMRTDKTVPQLIGLVTEYIDKMRSHSGNDCVQLSTIHSAKGTEYNKVCIIDLNKNFPNLRHGETTTEEQAQQFLEEEVRVLYVGITRTKKELYIYNDGSAFADVFRADAFQPINNPLSNILKKIDNNKPADITNIPEVSMPTMSALDKLLVGYKRMGE